MTARLRLIYQKVLGAMPSALSSLVRRCVAAGLGRSKPEALSSDAAAPDEAAPKSSDGTDPFDYVAAETVKLIFKDLTARPHQLLEVRRVREVLARERAHYLLSHGLVKFVASKTEAVAPFALQRNFEAAQTASDLDRPSIMTRAASAIDRVRQEAADMDVLSIGPRSEIEIFALLAAGFSKSRIRAVDLFSYSPFVQLGDMHALPFADNAFDIVFIGWVLTYSRDHQRATREIIRVCRDKAIVVVAGDYCDDTIDDPAFKGQRQYLRSCDQILSLFSGHVRRIYFRHDPDPPKVWTVMTVFEMEKCSLVT
jgi:hypothetical protein